MSSYSNPRSADLPRIGWYWLEYQDGRTMLDSRKIIRLAVELVGEHTPVECSEVVAYLSGKDRQVLATYAHDADALSAYNSLRTCMVSEGTEVSGFRWPQGPPPPPVDEGPFGDD